MLPHFNPSAPFEDLSIYIALTVLVISAGLAWAIGRANGLGKIGYLWLLAIPEAIVLGVGLMIIQGLVYGGCAEFLGWCKTQGDASMSNYFQPFYCIPLYWLIITVSAYWSRMTKPYATTVKRRIR